jgi:hypothetical protein
MVVKLCRPLVYIVVGEPCFSLPFETDGLPRNRVEGGGEQSRAEKNRLCSVTRNNVHINPGEIWARDLHTPLLRFSSFCVCVLDIFLLILFFSLRHGF